MPAGSDLNKSFAKCMFKANKSSIKILSYKHSITDTFKILFVCQLIV